MARPDLDLRPVQAEGAGTKIGGMDTLITSSDIAVLNAAREILSRVSRDAMQASFGIERGFDAAGVGRLAHAADSATAAIFGTLSTAKHYADQPLTDAQIHGLDRESPAQVEA